MELFKLNSTADPTLLQNGSMINGATSKLWVERYRNAGEFEIVAPISSGHRTLLPLGSLISHVDTKEIMIVENHQISDTNGEITTSGRSLETFLEQRPLGSGSFVGADNQLAFPVFVLPAALTWLQAVSLIKKHIDVADIAQDDNDGLVSFQTSSIVPPGSFGTSEEQTIKKDYAYEALLDLLAIDDLGIKIIRPGNWEHSFGTKTSILIHMGTDRTKEVTFSYSSGEVKDAEYLWSIKSLKNSAIVNSKWLRTRVDGPETSIKRRIMYVNASDLDDQLDVAPAVGAARTAMLAQLTARGRQALASQNELAITKAEISNRGTRYKYRRDYDIGDIVAVDGNYDTSTTARVIEYVEVEDSTGETSYPTLSLL